MVPEIQMDTLAILYSTAFFMCIYSSSLLDFTVTGKTDGENVMDIQWAKRVKPNQKMAFGDHESFRILYSVH